MIPLQDDIMHIFNFTLEDLPGEIWKAIPGLDEFGQISNYGRVKRLGRERQTASGSLRYYGPRILKSVLLPRRPLSDGRYHFGLWCTLSVDNIHHNIQPLKLVYHLFNHPFNMDNLRYVVTTINRNDLDIRPENLQLSIRYIYQKYRRNFTLDKKIQFYKQVRYDRAVIHRKEFISCYDQSGSNKHTFKGLEYAGEHSGLAIEEIEAAIQQPFTQLGGFYWRIGKRRKIDLSLILAHKEKLLKEKNGLRITQFDLNGNPINFYTCLADAAMDIGIPQSDLLNALDQPQTVAGFFLWRRGHIDHGIEGL